VALTLCLGKPADVYLIDEPSAYLDSEQRLHAAKVIKRYFILCQAKLDIQYIKV
jgi:ATP-binding cassette, sub-family E, member 1